jgi:hypothetical protein
MVEIDGSQIINSLVSNGKDIVFIVSMLEKPRRGHLGRK